MGIDNIDQQLEEVEQQLENSDQAENSKDGGEIMVGINLGTRNVVFFLPNSMLKFLSNGLDNTPVPAVEFPTRELLLWTMGAAVARLAEEGGGVDELQDIMDGILTHAHDELKKAEESLERLQQTCADLYPPAPELTTDDKVALSKMSQSWTYAQPTMGLDATALNKLVRAGILIARESGGMVEYRVADGVTEEQYRAMVS